MDRTPTPRRAPSSAPTMDIARRLSSALYGDAPKSNTGLETADVNDQETLDKLRDDAKKQARAQIANDLKKFLKKKNKHSPPPQSARSSPRCLTVRVRRRRRRPCCGARCGPRSRQYQRGARPSSGRTAPVTSATRSRRRTRARRPRRTRPSCATRGSSARAAARSSGSRVDFSFFARG